MSHVFTADPMCSKTLNCQFNVSFQKYRWIGNEVSKIAIKKVYPFSDVTTPKSKNFGQTTFSPELPMDSRNPIQMLLPAFTNC